jgi:putative toxin-antitoxin system antitoxin component (TIGR02293 family)
MTYDTAIGPEQISGEPTSPRSRRLPRAAEKTKAANRKPPGKASPWQEILARATQTFGSEDQATAWLKRPAAPLQDQTPQSLIATPEGFRQVEQLLGKIDHGIAV